MSTLSQIEDRIDMVQALRHLAPLDLILIQRLVDGHGVPETAHFLGMSHQACYKRLRRIRSQLAELLGIMPREYRRRTRVTSAGGD
ncbi:MAG: hypothetical protein WC683_04720 [bacterium]